MDGGWGTHPRITGATTRRLEGRRDVQCGMTVKRLRGGGIHLAFGSTPVYSESQSWTCTPGQRERILTLGLFTLRGQDPGAWCPSPLGSRNTRPGPHPGKG